MTYHWFSSQRATEEQKGDRTIFKEPIHKNTANFMKIITRFKKSEEILGAE